MAALVLSFDAGPTLAKDPPLASLTAEHFKDTATVEAGSAEGRVIISTQKGFVESSGPLHMVWHDEFLTASIDKNGQKSFQVHAEITYSGNWRYYQTANFQAADGPRSAAAVQTGKEAADCAVECLYTERVAFSVDEGLLRQLAAAYVPGKPVVWSFKFLSKSGPEHTAGLSNAEIAGLLLKLDDYTHAPSVVAAATTVGTAGAIPAQRLDLGVGAMAVAATAEHPNRAGLLIIAVTPGSAAQKAGLIVGDILTELDGRAIKQPAELQAALAACKPGAAVPIKLYRGTDPITLTARF